MRLSAALAVVLLVLPLPAASAGNSPFGDSAAAWPSFGPYTMADGSNISDDQDNNPGYSDLWAGSSGTLPSVYFETDGTNVFFRLRVRSDPSSRNGGYASTSYLVSVAVGGTQAAVIGLNGKPSASDFAYTSNNDGSAVREIYTTPFTNDGSGTSAGARWLAAPDEGYFVDFQVPIAQITAVAPSVDPSAPVQFFFGTSQAANLSVINKDFMIGSEVSYLGLKVVTLDGTPVGSAPAAVDDTLATTAGISATVDVAANDTDADGNLDPTTTTVGTAPSNGGVTNNGDGTLTYTPDPGYSGSDSFTYSICDTTALCDSATVNVTVGPAGSPPQAQMDIAIVGEDGSVVVNAAGNDTDPDGNLDPTTATITTSPTNGGVTNNGDGTFTYTPNPNYNGADSFTYTICDTTALCDTATVNLSVTAVDDPPTAVADTLTLDEDTSGTVNAAANDTDPDGNLNPTTATITTSPTKGGVTNNGDGTFTYTPNPNYNGADSFTYTICDTTGLCDTASVGITVDPVNDTPVAVDDPAMTPEDVPGVVNVLANDLDVDGDTLTVSAFDATSAAGATVSCTGPGVCTYTPLPEYSGVDTFSYTADDGNGGTATATVTMTVVGVNDPPGINDDAAATDEDLPVIIDLLGNDTDPDGDTLSIDFITQPPSGTVVDNGNGTVTYTPDANFSGGDAFTYRACDDGTPRLCAEASVSVAVAPVNDVPVARNDSASTNEDVARIISVLGNDSDADGDALTVTAHDAASAGGGTVSCTGGGVCTYTPAPFFNGTDTFSYTVEDGNGGSATATVTITVWPVNNRPTAVDDAVTVTEDVVATIPGATLTGNDLDPDNLPTELVVTAVTDGAHGTAVVVGGDVVYTPDPDYNGPDTLTYTVCDPGPLCDTGTIAVTVQPENDPPVAKDDTATTDEDVPVTVAVLANDGDIDGDPLTVTGIGTDPSNGTATINGDNTVTYTPDPDFFGTDEFSYVISDGNGGTTIGWVRFVTVNPVNDAPVANPDTPTVTEDGTVTIDAATNDTDIDIDPLTITTITQPTNGTATLNPDGTITYTPDPDYHGTDTLTYTICDPGGLCDTATITLTVTAVNDAPIANPDTPTVTEDGTVTIDAATNDTDTDGDPLTITTITQPTNGTATLNPDGTITYTPDPDYHGTDTLTYTICDPGGLCDTATITLTVTAVNDAPIANPDTPTVTEDGTVTIDAATNDTDTDGDPLTITTITQPTNGTATLNPDGTITYTPDPDYHGTDTLTYTICDPGGLCDTATIEATITKTPPPVAAALTLPAAVDGTPAPLTLDGSTDGFTVVVMDGALPPGLTLNSDGTWSGAATVAGTYTVTVLFCYFDDPLSCSSTVLSIVVELLPVTGAGIAQLSLLGLVMLLGGVALVTSGRRPQPARAPVRRDDVLR